MPRIPLRRWFSHPVNFLIENAVGRAARLPAPGAVAGSGRGTARPALARFLRPAVEQLEGRYCPAPVLDISFEGIDFDEDVANNAGVPSIPPDPIGAAGPTHVVSVNNTSIEWLTKDGTQENSQRLGKDIDGSLSGSFFEPLDPEFFVFDPKVLYDQYAERFVVVTLELLDTSVGDPVNDSRILLAVSDDSDPNGTWFFQAIDSKIAIGGEDHWADYPGFAVDEEAVYITNNMFTFGSFPNFGGSRLWIVDKAGLYAGGTSAVTVHDPFGATGALAGTAQPTHMYGTGPANVGTFIVTAGNSSGTDDLLSVIRVDNPLSSPTFTNQDINLGDIHDGSFSFPGTPQSGSSEIIDSGDIRTLKAVWRNDNLYTVNTVVPNSGPDAGQATTHWYRIDTSDLDALILADQGDVGAEDLGTGTFTIWASIAVDANDNLAIGFGASNSGIFGGAYYTVHEATDPAGTVQSTGVLADGLDAYEQFRWGDYSGIAIDPSDDSTFWLFNMYALTRASSGDGANGRWGTRWGSFSIVPPVPNNPPDAVDDPGFSTAEDAVLNVAAPGVLGNDTDPDGDTLTVTGFSATSAQGASVTVNANGSFSYDPTAVAAFNALAAGESVVDTFTYTVSDGKGGSDTATVSVTVNGVNDPPTAVDDTGFSTFEDMLLNVPAAGVLANDTDPDASDTLAVTGFSATSANGAAVTVNADGSFTYDPRGSAILAALLDGQSVVDTFTYTVSDGQGGSDTATVSVTVNGVTEPNVPPVATDDTGFATNENTPLNVGGPAVLANDTDANLGDTLTVSDFSATSANGAAVTVSPNGSFTYDPRVSATLNALTAVESVVDTFTYTVSDGRGGSDTATVFITVDGRNDAPDARTDSRTTDEDTVLNLPAPGVLANDTDPDAGDTLAVSAVNGSGANVGNPFLTANGATVTLNADGSLSYDPTTSATLNALAAGQSVDDTFTYTVSDGQGGSDTATVSITVNGRNDPPNAVNDPGFSTDEDTALNVPAPGVLGNDTDPDAGDTLTVTGFDAVSANGAAVTVNADGSFSYDPTGSATLNALATGESVVDTFTYTIEDGNGGSDTATVSVTVNGVNDAPDAVDDPAATDEGTPVDIDVLGNDTDPDATDDLTITGVSDPANGTAVIDDNGTPGDPTDDFITYTPDPGFPGGPDSFTYTISDGNGGTDTATVNVVVSPQVSLRYLVTGSDADGSQGVRVYNAETGEEVNTFLPFGGGYDGGVVVATADLNADGHPEVIAGMRRGADPEVRVFDGQTFTELPAYDFGGDHQPFDPGTTKGLFVAVGDVNWDDVPDIIVGTDKSEAPQVRVFSGVDGTELFAVAIPGGAFRKGVRVAAGEFTGDGHDDVVVGSGKGSWVRVIDGDTQALLPGKLGGFRAFGKSYKGGVWVASGGDIDGDGQDDIVVSKATGSATVRLFDGLGGDLLAQFKPVRPPAQPGSSIPFVGQDQSSTGNAKVRVALVDVDDDGRFEIVIGAGPGRVGRVQFFTFDGFDVDELDEFFTVAYPDKNGLYVGGSV